jgi:TRAP-type C4-dicarboxylate transport system permease small subunit
MTLGLAETRADGALSPVLGWPEWPFYLPGIASLLLWAMVAVLQIFEGERDG